MGERTGERPAAAGELRHVRWIGGGSGAGKSTIARELADRYGLRVYATDDVMADHARRCAPTLAPELNRFMAMDMDERWVNRSPTSMLETFHWYRGEAFDLIVDDLRHSSAQDLVIAEGFRLLPHLVEPLLMDPAHAVWLLPTPRFRRLAFDSRGTLWDLPSRTSDPERALANLLHRDRLFTDRLATETGSLGLPSIEVDIPTSRAQIVERLERQFGL